MLANLWLHAKILFILFSVTHGPLQHGAVQTRAPAPSLDSVCVVTRQTCSMCCEMPHFATVAKSLAQSLLSTHFANQQLGKDPQSCFIVNKCSSKCRFA